ncbi:hypothetical protein PL10110_650013 [Planktothrix agardhii]|nr:hypothetical protein PL10110_650013 [Planktothrix agardhii]
MALNLFNAEIPPKQKSMSFQTDIAGNTGTAPPNPPCTRG